MLSQYEIDHSMSLVNSRLVNDPPRCQYYGLSTDTKPTTATNGSAFIEMDTAKLYFFDADNSEWRVWNA